MLRILVQDFSARRVAGGHSSQMAVSCLFDVINNSKTSYYSGLFVLECPLCLSFWQGNFVIIILKYVCSSMHSSALASISASHEGWAAMSCYLVHVRGLPLCLPLITSNKPLPLLLSSATCEPYRNYVRGPLS
jgi:hypothetical protein